jgi:hypothetical protein
VINIPRKKSTAKKKDERGKKKDKVKVKGGRKSKAKEEDTPEKVEMPSISDIFSKDLGAMTDGCLMTDLLKLSWDEFRAAPQNVINNIINTKTITHMIRAGLEVYDVVQNIGPGGTLPENTKFRIYRAEKEFLLAVKAAMEMRLKELEKKIEEEGEKCETGGGGEPDSDLKKIKIKD